jgi:hypothetical protein
VAAARITVQRSPQFVGSRGRFRIVLDGKPVGPPLAAGMSSTVSTSAGVHEFYVTSDGRVRSPILELRLGEGEEVRLRTAPQRNPFVNLFRIVFQPSRAIDLELANGRALRV